MIRCIAAIDSLNGLIDTRPLSGWSSKLDKQYFKERTSGATILMGYNTYLTDMAETPLPNRRNLVASRRDKVLKSGFEQVQDARRFLENSAEDIWIIGGADLFAETVDLAEELYLTHVEANMHCEKKFPEFANNFELVSRSLPMQDGSVQLTFAVYKSKH